MVYGQLQYFQDELNQWRRIIAFHKEELKESLRQVNLILDFPVVSLPDSKDGNALVDRLMVQEQQFDHLTNHIGSQLQHLVSARTVNAELESSICEHQESLRGTMKSYEAYFLKTKYDCAFFLASFFQVDSLSAQA